MMYLVPMEFNNQRIMTTKALAEQYGTSEDNIKTNFNRNKERFIEGKHYYQLQGEVLKEFKRVVTESNDPSIKYASILTLWTDRGAARHAKILDTDEAWDVYEALEDTYFKVINNQIESNKQPIGIVESLHLELEASNKRIAELEQIVFAKQRRKLASKKQQLKIKPPLDIRLENITLDIVNQIVSNSISKGFLRTDKEGIAIDKDILFHEASKFNIKKHDIKIKLELLNKIIYKQVRMNGVPKWCIVFKNNVL